MGFRNQLDTILRTPKGERVLEEALRLARDPVSKQRIDELRRRLLAGSMPAPASRRRRH